jgi:hypothetical protein
VVKMPVFVHIIGAYEGGIYPPESVEVIEDLHEALKTIQSKNARIIDIKIDSCSDREGGISRTYLILYEAENMLMI